MKRTKIPKHTIETNCIEKKINSYLNLQASDEQNILQQSSLMFSVID